MVEEEAGVFPEVSSDVFNFGTSSTGEPDRVRQASASSEREPASTSAASTEESPPIRTRLIADIYNACTFALHVVDLVDFSEAVKSKEWQKAMDAEMEATTSNSTWKLFELPAGKKAVGLKWIYKTKLNAEGQI